MKTPITFTGLYIEIAQQGAIVLSQEPYIKELPTMNVESCIQNNIVTNPSDLRSTFRQAIGALIWTHQTRPDIGYTITLMSTSSVSACKSPGEAREICRRYNKIVKFMKNHPRKIHYTRVPPWYYGVNAIMDLMTWRAIAFADAGFASLPEHNSVEGNFMILGRVLSRDGVVRRHGGILDRRCAKIHRVCRSSLSAETHAAIATADWALWFQVFLVEIFTQKFEVRKISPPTSFPPWSPFGESPSDKQLNHEIMLAASPYQMIDGATIMNSDASAITIDLYCARCDRHQIFVVGETNCAKTTIYDAQGRIAQEAYELFKPLILTDCCSLFSSVIRLQPCTQERCSRILIAYIRDLQSLYTFSFIDSGTNLGDINTKHAGSLTILSDFFATGKFTLSFIGRIAKKKAK